MTRIISPKVLEFNVPVPVVRQGVARGSRKQLQESGDHMPKNGSKTYISMLKMYAKMNMVEQGWETNKTDAIYIVAVVNICPQKYTWGRKDPATGRKIRKVVTDMPLVRSKKLAIKKPDVCRISQILQKAFCGVVYERPSQVVATTVVRRYNSREGLDVLIGAPTDWKELVHDLRNA